MADLAKPHIEHASRLPDVEAASLSTDDTAAIGRSTMDAGIDRIDGVRRLRVAFAQTMLLKSTDAKRDAITEWRADMLARHHSIDGTPHPGYPLQAPGPRSAGAYGRFSELLADHRAYRSTRRALSEGTADLGSEPPAIA